MNNKGFTLVELLAVIALLAILTMIVVPIISASREKSEVEYYKGLEKDIIAVGKVYFSEHYSFLPKREGDTTQVDIATLVVDGYMEEPVSTKKNPCLGQVVVKRISREEYEYSVCMHCDSYTSKTCSS